MATWHLLNRARRLGCAFEANAMGVRKLPSVAEFKTIPLNIQYASDTDERFRSKDESLEFDINTFAETSIRPPFDCCWHEWVETDNKGYPVDCCALTMIDGDGLVWMHHGFEGRQQRKILKKWPPSIWGHVAFPIDEFEKNREQFLEYLIPSFCENRDQKGWLGGLSDAGEKFQKAIHEEGGDDDVMTVIINQTRTVLWSWLLLSCKNVTTIEVHPSTRRRNATEDPSRVVYRELQVSAAPGQRNQHESDLDEHGHGVAFHVRRGHFADYTKGNGLFGKYKGRYWIGPAPIGDPQYGTVLKSYSLVN